MSIRRLIPNLFTAGNLVGGIFAIVFAFENRLDIVPYFIFGSALCDFADGFVARLLKVQSDLGKQLDSLADMVTFGVAPGIIMYKILALSIQMENPDNIDWAIYLPFIIPVFAMFRLAKFNLDDNQKDHFIGLPTPAMTIFFVSFPLIMFQVLETNSMKQLKVLGIFANPYSLVFWIIFMSLLMVAPFKMFSLKFKSFGWKQNEIRYIFLTISVILLATLFWWALPIIILLYIILSLINNTLTKSAKDEI